MLAAETVVVNDNRNRTLAYSLATGKQTGGASTSPAAPRPEPER